MFSFLLNHLPLTAIFKLVPGFLMFQDDDTPYSTYSTYSGMDTTTLWIIIGVCLVFAIFVIAGIWKVFEKAGEPGWASIIPIYNAIVMLKVARKPGWWFLLLLIPGVNIIIAIIVAIEMAKNFGKGTGFGLGLAFLGFIFYPMLGFGDARYMPYGNQYAPAGYGNPYPPNQYPPPPPPPAGYGR